MRWWNKVKQHLWPITALCEILLNAQKVIGLEKLQHTFVSRHSKLVVKYCVILAHRADICGKAKEDTDQDKMLTLTENPWIAERFHEHPVAQEIRRRNEIMVKT
jgi:hypothetical protein